MVYHEIEYPYMPSGRRILYVDSDNEYMQLAKEHARGHSLDEIMPGAAVIVKEGKVIGIGANGSNYHKTKPCRRKELGCKAGEGYELCEGCHPKNHSEPSAIHDAINKGNYPQGADLYLWGHWWFCESCWGIMLQAGINEVFLLEHSEVLFNKEHPNNIIGRQFELV